ncbi:AEC family transporter [Facklamia sp. 7083-14-GEN3]|uniref:AEC family transporter n=1 Tax=Facklamia sp. 7083-14-GEN3 TaxID=2973478 RepID=UPI00215BE62A|nr:AEC family transporter [Facklamia sp. 7083-14-GEN3]MCR8969372.1 AEC family transporter [Facklamia sp. 7083-14-GEN3]
MQLDFMSTLQSVLVLFILIIIGFFAGRLKVISAQGQKDITNLVLYITMPATIFNAMQLDFNMERVQRAFTILIIVAICYTAMLIFGWLVAKQTKLTIAEQDVFRVALLLSNTSFMGYPIVSNLLGEEALFYAVIGAGFLFEIISWSIGIYLMGRNGSGKVAFNWKKIVLSPGILSIVVGLIFFLFSWQVPQPLDKVLNILSPATSPLAMIVVGLILSRSNVSKIFANKFLYVQAFLKLVFIPLIILFTLKALNFSNYELIIPTIMLGMPTASYVAMFAQNYDNHPEFASQMVFMTSLLSVVSIPLITLLF